MRNTGKTFLRCPQASALVVKNSRWKLEETSLSPAKWRTKVSVVLGSLLFVGDV